MRKSYDRQARLDLPPISAIQLNLECRDEIIPVLRGLKHLHSKPEARDQVLRLVREDVNKHSTPEFGRPGMDYWQIVVLAAVRIGCGLNYDKLQDLADQHRTLRQMLRLGDWDGDSFSWRCIEENLTLLSVKTVKDISTAIVKLGHEIAPKAAEMVRGDAFVIKTNIHYPTESSLIADGIRMLTRYCTPVAVGFGQYAWRQSDSMNKKVKNIAGRIDQICSKRGPNWYTRAGRLYGDLLKKAARITEKVEPLLESMNAHPQRDEKKIRSIKFYLNMTRKVMDTARRRFKGVRVPNEEKVFSLFEPHTQLYIRGKAKEPVQFGRMALVFEDAAGFIVHHEILDRDVQEREIVVDQTKTVQELLDGRVIDISFDRGFHSQAIIDAIEKFIPYVCIPKPGAKKKPESRRFRETRKRHPGVESAIGALQSGNGLDRCPDRTEVGLKRFAAYGIMARNLQVLGRLLIEAEAPKSEAARTKRAA